MVLTLSPAIPLLQPEEGLSHQLRQKAQTFVMEPGVRRHQRQRADGMRGCVRGVNRDREELVIIAAAQSARSVVRHRLPSQRVEEALPTQQERPRRPRGISRHIMSVLFSPHP